MATAASPLNQRQVAAMRDSVTSRKYFLGGLRTEQNRNGTFTLPTDEGLRTEVQGFITDGGAEGQTGQLAELCRRLQAQLNLQPPTPNSEHIEVPVNYKAILGVYPQKNCGIAPCFFYHQGNNINAE